MSGSRDPSSLRSRVQAAASPELVGLVLSIVAALIYMAILLQIA